VALVGKLLFGTGMRLMEGLRLRVKDIDFSHRAIIVREGKGGKDRVVMLPDVLTAPLREQLEKSRVLWRLDRDGEQPGVEMPDALARKYPRAAESWSWHWVFPAPHLSVDPRSGVRRRHHLYEQRLQRALKRAAQEAGITKLVSVHSLRHAFATTLLQAGYDIRTVQELLGHADVATTMIYTHVLKIGGGGVRSPLDLPRIEQAISPYVLADVQHEAPQNSDGQPWHFAGAISDSGRFPRLGFQARHPGPCTGPASSRLVLLPA
jgi:integron integrase